MNKLLTSAAAVALAGGLSPAHAQVAPPPGVAQGTAPMVMQPTHTPPIVTSPVRVRTMVMQREMTREQMVQHIRLMFARLDKNHDGFITKDEVAALHLRMMGMQDAMSPAMDGHAMEMDHQRMRMNPGAMFDRLDANHDGMISRQEFNTAHARMQERRVVVMRGGGREKMAEHLFEMADTNHDGRVSLQEAETAALAHFDRMDSNSDGRITPDERRQSSETMRQGRRG